MAVERDALVQHGARIALRVTSLFQRGGSDHDEASVHDSEIFIPLILRAAQDASYPITVSGNDYPTRDGTCVRDYVHVSDLARAHVLALDALARGDISAQIFNLGCGNGYTVKEVIDVAQTITRRYVPVNVGATHGDPALLVASSNRIAKTLGWCPQESSLEAIVGSGWKWETTFSQQPDANHTPVGANGKASALPR